MTKPQSSDISAHDASRDMPDVWAKLTHAASEAPFRQRQNQVGAGSHPSPVQVYAYVAHQLSDAEVPALEEHLAYCAECAQEALRIRLFEATVSEGFGTGTAAWAVLAEYYWEPEGAGEALVAADTLVMQEHVFETPFGQVAVQCAWGRDVAEEPAFIWLAWRSHLPSTHRFVIRLLDPQTHALRYAIDPGLLTIGEQAFSKTELGFDPLSERWQVAVSIRKHETTV